MQHIPQAHVKRNKDPSSFLLLLAEKSQSLIKTSFDTPSFWYTKVRVIHIDLIIDFVIVRREEITREVQQAARRMPSGTAYMAKTKKRNAK